MKRATLQAAAVCLFVAAASAHAAAQTRPPDAPARTPDAPTQQAVTTANEDFDLNITERRINQSDFHAETAVETDGARGLNLKIGVAVRAGEIEALLRNVQGHVRFRATLEPVLRLLDAHRGAQAPTRPPPDNSP